MNWERKHSNEIELGTLSGFVSTFIPRFDAYPIQLQNGTYITRKEPLTLDLVKQHLRGYLTLGAYALDEDSKAKYVCLDADTKSEWGQLLKMASELAKVSITAYLEQSRRGGHLWLFTSKIDGLTARQFGKQLLREYGVKPMEIYPKQAKLSTGVGSFVRLPLGIHRKTSKRYYFIDLDGSPLAPTVREQIAILANPDKVPLEYIHAVVARIPAPQPQNHPPTPLFKRPDGNLLPSEQIKAAISTYDFVTQYVEVDQNGKGLCPFHDDHHPSFQVSKSGDFWHCYAGCGGGDLLHFWQKVREKTGQDDSFKATVADLMKRFFGG